MIILIRKTKTHKLNIKYTQRNKETKLNNNKNKKTNVTFSRKSLTSSSFRAIFFWLWNFTNKKAQLNTQQKHNRNKEI